MEEEERKEYSRVSCIFYFSMTEISLDSLLFFFPKTTGSYVVRNSSADRAELSAIFNQLTPRTKSRTLFSSIATPLNYDKTKHIATSGVTRNANMASITNTPTSVLPKPDWSEFTFFAPLPIHPSPNTYSTGVASKSSSTSNSPTTTGVSFVGSRTYVCLRHTPSTLHIDGSQYSMPKFRYCQANIIQPLEMDG